ncbi:MAG: UDP-glucose 4-epimerase GalE [Spongiibacteraceae bacterium]
MKTVLVTGGAGYVGSHCCKAFAQAGWRVVTLDNLSRGRLDAVRWGPFVEANVADEATVLSTIDRYQPDVVAHFAAYAYVGESVDRPDLYYANNSLATFALLEAMRKAGLKRIVFSSTCATYGHPQQTLIDETHPQAPINPYGWSKFMVERMLENYAVAFGFSSIALRYFNAAGCDPEGEIGENHDPETHAIPLAIAAALKPDAEFTVFGTDFDTRDGSAVRDYIHVADLAAAHVLAAERLSSISGAEVFNLGTGVGTSVLEMIAAVCNAAERECKMILGPRRAGDPAALVASAEKAKRVLGWSPVHSFESIVSTALAWQKINSDAAVVAASVR